MFKGSFVALITPFRDGKVDEEAFAKLVEWQIAEGTHGLVPCGTTGESPTLSHEEHKRVVEICVEVTKKRVPVIAGAGSNNTVEAIELTRFAKDVGADAVLSVTGYYNKPSQEGQYQHFKAISDAVDLPIFLYNIPGRNIVDISVETMVRLAELKNVVGVKDATSNLARTSMQRHLIGKDFIQLSGEDASSLGFNAHGGVGSISVTANVAPKLCAEFQTATLKGDFARALELQDRLMPLHNAMFLEPSPGPVKYAASLLGLCRDEIRLPMTSVTEPVQVKVREAMRHAGLLN
ncbi:MAG: 4-hydroxy-tetrahydrodipicolinate synthase [Parvibaculum sp.]|uniref:4-hydroxy-tetrahydrodipicolinate synthase n=1 Tax=Parvibaculum sp. TaxID=2024848 RepID=UPI003C77F0EB